ncbi:hypothetical protein IRP63_14390 (plasmid) [Clostridium botulinum]|uniref:Uncharacterized protein n=1 Tax=Clostridium botulinum C/D str. DC5 TaxID=1443128 RepID=A0A0A0I116_CLOBO|nr:hypothetical protein [Clostridium botulinum]KGM93300.1 hypothetical protein Z955_15065 [Clostridium botulinum C/D str. DC5]KOC45523.1 hypothetical protein ADU88_13640 [Clostridium botulinum]KOC56830.1 hypothetical protein ADU89_01085 [Clostridium botulinum]KOC57305.1 hypothetical protein ADU90_05625 [Clostridium botulinum]MCD3232527.1 hypothetical protein [Clostridium botulinum D/C]
MSIHKAQENMKDSATKWLEMKESCKYRALDYGTEGKLKMTITELIDKLNSIYIFHEDLEVDIQDKEITF